MAGTDPVQRTFHGIGTIVLGRIARLEPWVSLGHEAATINGGFSDVSDNAGAGEDRQEF